MRPSDVEVFSNAARGKFWILVRITNKHSLKYIGEAGYVPKNMECKAKTATKDVLHYELKGLVVSPKIHPDAFEPDRLEKTLKEWKKMNIFEGKGSSPTSPFSVQHDQRSKHYGCLMYNGKYIHGDYDLFDIIDITQPHRNLALHLTDDGRIHRVGANFYRVQNAINSAIGTDMVQHGAEAQFRKFKEIEDEFIDAFGPNGEYVTILNKYSLGFWYRDRFEGRQFLGIEKPKRKAKK